MWLLKAQLIFKVQALFLHETLPIHLNQWFLWIPFVIYPPVMRGYKLLCDQKKGANNCPEDINYNFQI